MEDEKSTTKDDVTICEFCKEGAWADEICGKLHVEKIDGGKKTISAHHKCMQYSACLIQYKFANFGGFKIDKVQQEIRRGRFMACSICKNDHMRKGKWKGATAGCAIKSCRKTFHYYCAKIDPVAITKRMLIRYKNSKKEVVLYRVFCGNEHRDLFKANKEVFLATNVSGDSDDDEDDSDDDDTENDDKINNGDDGDKDEKTNSATADVTADVSMEEYNGDVRMKLIPSNDISICSVGSPCPNNMSVRSSPMNNRVTKLLSSTPLGNTVRDTAALSPPKLSPTREVSDHAYSDSTLSNGGFNKPIKESTKSNKVELSTDKSSASKIDNSQIKSDKDQLSTDRSAASKTDNSRIKSDKNKLSTDRSPMPAGKNTGSGKGKLSLSRKVKEIAEKSRVASGSDTDASESVNRSFEDYALVLLDKVDYPKPGLVRKEIFNMMKEFDVKEQNCILWSQLFDGTDVPQFERKLPHLMSDIVMMFKERDYHKIIKLLIESDRMKVHLQNYDYVLKLQAKMDEEMVDRMQQSLYDSIESELTEACKKAKYKVAKLVRLKCNPDVRAFILKVNDTFDPKGHMRSRFADTTDTGLDIFKLSSEVLIKDEEKVSIDDELDKLLDFTKSQLSKNYVLTCSPQDEMFLLKDDTDLDESESRHENLKVNNSVIGKLENKIRENEEKSRVKCDSILILRCVDPEVVNYQAFCHKAMKKFVANANRKQDHIMVVNVSAKEFRTINDIIPASFRKENPEISIYTAFNPKKYKVTCALVMLQRSPVASSSGTSNESRITKSFSKVSADNSNGYVDPYDSSDTELPTLARRSSRSSFNKSTESLDTSSSKSPSKSRSSPARSSSQSSSRSSPSPPTRRGLKRSSHDHQGHESVKSAKKS